jgi:YD repeat-containing protein
VSFDAAGRITALPATANAAQTQTYGYDSLDRLTSALNASNSHSYAYDLLGNRLSHTVGAATTTYQYPPTSNRLASIIAPAGAISTVVHDANGSIIDNGSDSFTYDTRGRLIGAQTTLGPVTYQVNSLGQRYLKTLAGNSTVYHYDSAGHLIAETNSAGVTQVEYLWLGDQPVAMFR